MATPFDATLNSLIDATLGDWALFLAGRVGVGAGPASTVPAAALDTDLSSALFCDRLFRIEGPAPAVVHLELESSSHLHSATRLVRYNANAEHATGLPVYSVLMLLRPEARASNQTGVWERRRPDGTVSHRFEYEVVRVWRESVAGLVAAGPGLAPLALLTDEAAGDLEAAFARVEERLRQPDVPGTLKKDLFGSTYVLCGLRYEAERIAEVYRNMALTLEDSTTYQAILQKGQAQGRAEGQAQGRAEGQALGQALGQAQAGQAILLRLGARRFGPAPAGVEARVRAVADPDLLAGLAERVADAAGWDELLATC